MMVSGSGFSRIHRSASVFALPCIIGSIARLSALSWTMVRSFSLPFSALPMMIYSAW